jgi:predicted esterase
MPSIYVGLVKYLSYMIVLAGLCLMGPRLAMCQTLGGKDFIGQYTNAGFTEVPSSPFIKAFLKDIDQHRLEALNRSALTKPIRLTVYIEGDGAAWRARQIPPRDPSPDNPIAAQLALVDSSLLVAYLARPCMYLGNELLKQCSNSLWTDARFGQEALLISNQALDSLVTTIKKEYSIPLSSPLELNLVGYSGGGVMATLLASQRSDVVCLNSLASPLDIEVWTKLQKVAPLLQSFNPAFPDERLTRIPQMHWFGAKDRVVPPQALGRYHNWSPTLELAQVVKVIPSFNHHDFWVQEWPNLKEKSCLN